MKIKNLIFDLDNTLVNCGPYYTNKKKLFSQTQAERTGFTSEFCQTLLEKIDVIFTSTPDGFSRNRFPRSFFAASIVMDVMSGNELDVDSAIDAYAIGESVFSEPYDAYEGVPEMLGRLAEKYNLFLLTKGDRDIQLKKVLNNQFHLYFPSKNIYVVAHKTSADLLHIMKEHQLNVDECLMIGDSPKDDIGAANGVKMRSVLVCDGSDKWEYENTNHKPTTKIPKVTDLEGLLEL